MPRRNPKFHSIAITGERPFLDKLYNYIDNRSNISYEKLRKHHSGLHNSDALACLFTLEADMPNYRIFIEDLDRLTTAVDWETHDIILRPKELPENTDAVALVIRGYHDEIVEFMQKFADTFGVTVYVNEKFDHGNCCCTTTHAPTPGTTPISDIEGLFCKP